MFCEKPVGGTPRQTVVAERAARHAGVITGVGYNYRWAPLVQYAKQLIESGEIGEVTNYYGRFFSMYGSDPMGDKVYRQRLSSWVEGQWVEKGAFLIGLAFFAVNLILAGVTGNQVPGLAITSISFDLATCSFVMKGGTIYRRD